MSVNCFFQKQAYKQIAFFTYFLFTFFSTTNIIHAQQSDGESMFTSDLINIEATVDKVFRYSTSLQNSSSQDRIYDLTAKLPEGWNSVFRARGKQITSIKVEAGSKETINVELYPSYRAKPSKYDIRIMAHNGKGPLQLDLEAVVSGAYAMEITTPTERLSDEVTEGNQKEIPLVVRNIASLTLKDIEISANTPPQWNAVLEPAKIEELAPGETKNIVATLKVPDKTIVGDYVTTFTAKNANTKDEAVFRMTVVTSLLSGWIGILVILIAIALVYNLIRKYGRR